ncbi:MAG TPA: TlpA disulfide reductase family protein [Acidimicrobiales bacterium]|nr:TlpA disulfide reductase family protein [Acidimicrobiales bacterium]
MPLPAGAVAPSFTLPDGEGAPRSLADLTRSGPALLAFFKISCPTCQLAFPVIAELQRRYGDAVPVVAVSQSKMGDTRPWLDRVGFAGPVLDDEAGHFEASRSYGVEVVPTLVLVEDGRVEATTEAWDREGMNGWARDLGGRSGRDTSPVSTTGDGRPAFKPG